MLESLIAIYDEIEEAVRLEKHIKCGEKEEFMNKNRT